MRGGHGYGSMIPGRRWGLCSVMVEGEKRGHLFVVRCPSPGGCSRLRQSQPPATPGHSFSHPTRPARQAPIQRQISPRITDQIPSSPSRYGHMGLQGLTLASQHFRAELQSFSCIFYFFFYYPIYSTPCEIPPCNLLFRGPAICPDPLRPHWR